MWRALLSRLSIPDLEVIEEAVLAHAAELHLRLRRMRDARGLQKAHGLAVDRSAHGVAYCFQHEGVPSIRIQLQWERRVLTAGGCGWLASGAFRAGDSETLLVYQGNALRCDARQAKVPVVRAIELPVVKLRRDRLRAAELEAELDHAVLRRNVVADDRLMSLHRWLAIRRRSVKAHLHALQRAFLNGKRRHHDGPSFAQLRLLEVIGEEQFLLLRDGLSWDGGKLRRIGGEGRGCDETGEREEADVHPILRSVCFGFSGAKVICVGTTMAQALPFKTR